ncbi:hypothetical protein D187_010257 [Cystobacter fuscus DSM 2262]|uniref:Uncharacterized protein n=1 Tax=Cystobacter fuscus (strain ATCC 25194 / DSM 2262 / NBRC 100088 / M29) TaxID=1242864 RepID=S9QYB0_CYSF2|nr:hypothetical protein [Cystobacter fuscus]EPX61638.1 hypothetical protein D187_010257 [Cystobacter fuscus DSM 2262]
MDYRKFLAQVESVVLPYFGGAHVDQPSRRLRVSTSPAPGWYRFEVRGRTATARESAGPEGLDGLPRVRGHLWGTRLVHEGAVAEPVRLLPEDTPPRFAPLLARRWHDGGLVFETSEFESEAESTARLRLERRETLTELKGVPASLRAAFGYALLETRARALDIRFAPAEVRGVVRGVAEQGAAVAEARLRTLAFERSIHVTRARHPDSREERTHPARGREEEASRVERALSRAGAWLLDSRRLSGGQLEVTFDFMGERFQSIVEADTLRVVDAGLCLAGADALVTLESLPAVIREAIEEDVLVITRHV